jgi:hypothetical protein
MNFDKKTLEILISELLGDVGKLHDSIKALPKSFENVHDEIEYFSKKINEVSEEALTKHIATTSNTLIVLDEEVEKKLQHIAERTSAIAEQAAKMAVENTQSTLIQSAIHSFHDTASKVISKQRMQWLTGCLIATLIALGGFAGLIHHLAYTAGEAYGYSKGYEESKDEKAAASWANTPDGQLAFKFARNGALPTLIHCTGKGWRIQNGYCYVTQDKGHTQGWLMP